MFSEMELGQKWSVFDLLKEEIRIGVRWLAIPIAPVSTNDWERYEARDEDMSHKAHVIAQRLEFGVRVLELSFKTKLEVENLDSNL